MSGSIGILNVGAGDTKLTFDRSNPVECIRAARIVKDMLRRGYALLIATGADADGRPTYSRVREFDENAFEYIIADGPCESEASTPADSKGANHGAAAQTPAAGEEAAGEVAAPVKRPRGRPKRIDATKVRGVAVARTAGG